MTTALNLFADKLDDVAARLDDELRENDVVPMWSEGSVSTPVLVPLTTSPQLVGQRSVGQGSSLLDRGATRQRP